MQHCPFVHETLKCYWQIQQEIFFIPNLTKSRLKSHLIQYDNLMKQNWSTHQNILNKILVYSTNGVSRIDEIDLYWIRQTEFNKKSRLYRVMVYNEWRLIGLNIQVSQIDRVDCVITSKSQWYELRFNISKIKVYIIWSVSERD